MKTMDIEFHGITLSDKEWLSGKFAEDDRNACEYTFSNNFIWRKAYKPEVGEMHGCAIIRFLENGKHRYTFPIGNGDKKRVIEELLLLSSETDSKLIMSPLGGEDKNLLLEWFPGQFLIEGNRDDYDYIYSREKLATLAGKKLHGKRNHIARFKDGDDWSYEPMTADNLEECRTMTYSWMKMRSEKWNEEMETEVIVLHEAFDHMKELGLIGGILRKKGEIVAFCIGERLNSDTFVVHFEKAYPDLQGAYPMINQQFVLHECEGYAYINREEDTGDLGLRKAKMSYYPDILLKKYVARESRVVFADREKDEAQIKKIWQTCFGDEEEYISFYLEHRMTETNMLVIYQDGKAVSMASFLPVEYNCGGTYVSARYVYAVATLPEYRGRGLARDILTFARQKFKEPLILAPAEESLCRYYEKIGFQRAFKEVKQPVTGDIQAMEISDADEAFVTERVTPEEYAKIRDEKLAREGYVRWDDEAIQFAIEQNTLFGGETCVIASEEKTARLEQTDGYEKDILMYSVNGDTLTILETTLSKARIAQVLPGLLQETGSKTAIYRQLPGMIWLPQAMQEEQIPEDGYLNLTLS